MAGLAVLLFALDDAHAMAATWIANRNALIATTLGLLSLIAHHRWRRDGWKWGGIASAVCLALALLAGEAAVGAGRLPRSLGLHDGGRPRRRRIVSLLPTRDGVVCLGFFYRLANLGAHGSGLYLDPGDGPSTFAAAIFQRAPILMMGQWSPVPAETATLVTARKRASLRRRWVAARRSRGRLHQPRPARPHGSLPRARDVLRAAARRPGPFPRTGFSPSWVSAPWAWWRSFWPDSATAGRALLERAVAGFLVITHLVIAPLFTPIMAYAMKIYGQPMEAAAASLPPHPTSPSRTCWS